MGNFNPIINSTFLAFHALLTGNINTKAIADETLEERRNIIFDPKHRFPNLYKSFPLLASWDAACLNSP
jgi:hypothetical protein